MPYYGNFFWATFFILYDPLFFTGACPTPSGLEIGKTHHCVVWTKQTFPICFCIPIIFFNWHFNCSNVLQVTNYEMVVNLFQTSHNLTWYSASVHKFTSIYPVCSTYELTKQFMQICVKNCAIDLKKNNLYLVGSILKL